MSYGVWHHGDLHGEPAPGGWMHCPITGDLISGSREHMRSYARDMNALGSFVRPRGKKTTGFVARPLPSSGDPEQGGNAP